MFLTKKLIIMIITLIISIHYIYSQAPEMPYLALDFGGGSGNILVDGISGGMIIDPKLRLSPAISIGNKYGLSFSEDGIIAIEAQAYFRWNFLRFPNQFSDSDTNTTDIFIQGGIGVLGAVKGKGRDEDNRWDKNSWKVTNTRSSILADLTVGVSMPLSSRWHLEPSARFGYPFQFGFALTAGYKFPLPQKKVIEVEHDVIYRTEYVDIVRRNTVTETVVETVYQPVIETVVETVYEPVIETVTETVYQPVIETVYVPVIQTVTREIIKRMMITQVEYILFGPDISRYNVGIDDDAIALNNLVIDQIALLLNENPDCQVRIEGHANPYTGAPEDVQVLAALSANRSYEVARLLRAKGVKNEQLIVIAYGGTRTISRDRAHGNLNRRVELIVFQGEIL